MPPLLEAIREVDRAMFAPVPACWICGQTSFQTVYPAIFDTAFAAGYDPELGTYSGQRIAMRRCLHCGFIQPEALPTLPRYFDRLYNQQWSEDWIERDFDHPFKDFVFQTILHELDARTRSRTGARTLLDVGAHGGKFMFLARQAGWQPEGIELNPRTAAYAARRTGLPVHQMNAEALARTQDKRYAAITLTDVLEHLPDPLSILQMLAGLLEPAGWLAIKVPCGLNQLTKERVRARLGLHGRPDHLADNLVHLSHFSPRSLRLALERSGFEGITITIGAPELSDARASGALKDRWSNFFRRGVYQLGRWLPGGVYTPMALNLQAYARKKAA